MRWGVLSDPELRNVRVRLALNPSQQQQTPRDSDRCFISYSQASQKRSGMIVKTGTEEESERPSAITKLRQITTGLQEGRDRKRSCRAPQEELARLTAEERSILERVWQKEEEFEKETTKVSSGSPSLTVKEGASSSQENCRICRKAIGSNEQSRKCDECGQLVCEDCASYSKDPNDINQEWNCSFCRRRQKQDRLGIESPPGTGMHRVPSVRRMNQRMELLGREGSILVPELSVDLEEKIGLEGSPPFRLEKKESKRLAEESDRSFSLESRDLNMIQQSDQEHEIKQVFETKTSQVEKQKPIECIKESKIIRGSSRSTSRASSPEMKGVSRSKDGHLSLDFSLERRPSSEYRKGTRRCQTEHGLYTSSTSSHHQHHQKDSSQQRHSSASESSIDEHRRDEVDERKQRNRIRKRSRIQRQKYYVEEPDSDPTIYRVNILGRSDAKSSLASREIISGSAEALNRRLNYVTDHLTKKPLSLAGVDIANRHSSDSSELSDVSGDVSPFSDRSGHKRLHGPYYSGERLEVRTSKKHQKSRKPSVEFAKERTISYAGAMDSSLSSDEQELIRLSTDKSYSLEDPEMFLYPNVSLGKSIPSVFVETVPDIDSPPSPYPQNEEIIRRHSTGRVLPPVPVPENQLGLQLLPSGDRHSTYSLNLPYDEKGLHERRSSAPESEDIKIAINEVDSKLKTKSKPRLKKVRLHRDKTDTGARTRGFGMRVLGGKSAEDGKLYATVAWTLPGGQADQKGIHQGDIILEWAGIILIDRTFEEVSSIIESTGDTVEIVFQKESIKAGEDKSSRYSPGEPAQMSHHKTALGTSSVQRKPRQLLMLTPEPIMDTDVQPVSPTRRKLPRTPDQPLPPFFVGDVGVQMWFDRNRSDLIITLLSARGLRLKKTTADLPRAFAKLRLVPHSGFGPKETQLADPSTSPKWNKKFVFPSVTSDELLEKSVEVTVWNQSPTGNKSILGGTEIPLRKTDLQDCPEWYPLTIIQAPTQKPPHSGVSCHDVARQFMKQSGNYQGSTQSLSEEKCDKQSDNQNESVVKSSSMDFTLLHPEDAWDRLQQISPEDDTKLCPHTDTKSFRSTSPSGRNSGKLTSQDSLPAEIVREQNSQNKTRRTKFSRTLSLRTDKEDRSVVLDSKLASSSLSSPDLTPENEIPIMTIGPGDIRRGAGQVFSTKMKLDRVETLGEIKLGFLLTKSQLEIEVFCARQLPASSLGQPPDTYIKTFLKEGQRQMQKRKTRVVRCTSNPQYRQTLKYSASDILARHLLVMVFQRQKGFDHNQPIGAVEIELGRLDLTKSVCWYPLYPLPSEDFDSNEST
ncbi:regulating synaptic membrane exocytosis protein 2-like [Limulus polyphemus]|uniref:Regulating synaptic membrane exocytosis protein 2-like n=1 Tax=Limulus polyphemus TaxID=6850 RepID=A0ABM1SBA3_LIMPO|nr:regulating synaptic membrane exocytosis protein 2-like [Limulus polyphemus]